MFFFVAGKKNSVPRGHEPTVLTSRPSPRPIKFQAYHAIINFCLPPSAKDLGITRVVIAAVAAVAADAVWGHWLKT